MKLPAKTVVSLKENKVMLTVKDRSGEEPD